MQTVAIESVSHHDNRHLEQFDHVGNDGNAATAPNENRFVPPSLQIGASRRFHLRQVERNQRRHADIDELDRYLDFGRSHRFDMTLDTFEDLVGILIAHQSRRNLRAGLGRDDRFRTGTAPTSPQAVHVERRSG